MVTTPTHLRSIVDHDGAVILDIDHDLMLTLNSTGAYVWARLQQGRLMDEIVADLASESGADIATVNRDVRAFMEQLMSKRLLRA